jgi:hypothetical protein
MRLYQVEMLHHSTKGLICSETVYQCHRRRTHRRVHLKTPMFYNIKLTSKSIDHAQNTAHLTILHGPLYTANECMAITHTYIP